MKSGVAFRAAGGMCAASQVHCWVLPEPVLTRRVLPHQGCRSISNSHEITD